MYITHVEKYRFAFSYFFFLCVIETNNFLLYVVHYFSMQINQSIVIQSADHLKNTSISFPSLKNWMNYRR